MKLAMTCLAVLLAASDLHATEQPADQPNLLYVFSDQQSHDALGCYGNREIITPNIDRFAEQAVLFNHCVSTSPVCTPYRSMLLSGQHTLRNGCVFNDIRMLPGGGTYLPEVLRDRGYQMGYVGKWHLFGGDRNRPVARGVDRYGFDGLFLTNNCTLEYRAGKSWYWDQQNQRQVYQRWEPDAQTDQAIGFLKSQAKTGRPWCLFVSWHAPHNWGREQGGYLAPQKYLDMYDPAKLTLRSDSPDTPLQRMRYQGYYAMCTSVDENFGRLLETLDEMGQRDNTIVVYTSDHGDTLHSPDKANAGHKRRPEDTSCRVPLIVGYGEKLRARRSDLLVGTLDLMPTLLAMMGIQAPDTCEGKNLLPAIQAGDDDAVESVPLVEFSENWRGVYTKDYTYSYGPAGEQYNRLYDRKADPDHTNNLFGHPDYADVQKKLHAQTLAWMDKFGDRFVDYQQLCEKIFEIPVRPVVGPTGAVNRANNGTLKGRPEDFQEGLKSYR